MSLTNANNNLQKHEPNNIIFVYVNNTILKKFNQYNVKKFFFSQIIIIPIFCSFPTLGLKKVKAETYPFSFIVYYIMEIMKKTPYIFS